MEDGDRQSEKDFLGNLGGSFLPVYVGIIGSPDKQETLTCVLPEFLAI